ncbi:MAG: hypothetical protein WDZ41_02640 [Candidatus Babeliales bacterium]
MKQIFVFYLLCFSISSSACFDLRSVLNFFRPSNHEVRSTNHELDKIEMNLKEEIRQTLIKWRTKEISKTECKKTIMELFLPSMFIFSQEKLQELFPGVTLTKVEVD